MARVLPPGTKGFLVTAIVPSEHGLRLDGRGLDDEIRIGDRFIEMHLVMVDEVAGTSISELLAKIDVIVMGIETYGRARKFLGPGMTGCLEVENRGEEMPLADTLIAGPASRTEDDN